MPRLIAIASGLLAAGMLFPFTAKPISWDELVYMGLAFFPERKAWVLNRYAHAYAMMPFMWLSGDPYVGARLFWCALVGVTVAALMSALLRVTGTRVLPLAFTLYLWAGQETLFRSPGVALADYSVMAALAVGVSVILARSAARAELSPAHAAALGVLFLLGLKAKESAVVALLFVAALFSTAEGRWRCDRRSLRLVASWIAGVALGAAVIMMLDGLFLHDALFSVRRSSWREVLGFNLGDLSPDPPGRESIGHMLRQLGFVPVILYLAAALMVAWRERDARLQVIYALPVVFVALLAAVVDRGTIRFAARYLIPIQPIMSVLTVVAFWKSAPLIGRAHAARRAVVILLAVVVVAAELPQVRRVAEALARREAQSAGDRRFAGFFEVARAVRVEDTAVIFVSDRLYDGAIRPGVVAALTRMNFNARLPRRQIVQGAWPAPDVDYAVVSLPEYQQWLSAGRGDPQRAILGSDGAVALLCLRGPCPRR